jgi:ABC-type phosphate transport system permease subunit
MKPSAGSRSLAPPLSGPGLLPAALVLAIMILPTVAAISQHALHLVPYRTKEAAYGMGTTRWEAILKVMLPTAAGGIASAMVLGFSRALGETMALAMLDTDYRDPKAQPRRNICTTEDQEVFRPVFERTRRS